VCGCRTQWVRPIPLTLRPVLPRMNHGKSEKMNNPKKCISGWTSPVLVTII
jgi:hypothetical protein